LSGALLTAGAGVLIPACVHDDSTLFIRSVLAPPQSSGTAGCMYTADPTQPTLSAGEVNVALASRYYAELLVGNQMTPQGDPTQARTETSRIVVDGAVVTLTDANGTQLTAYTTATSQTIDPASGADPSYAVMGVIAVDANTIDRFAGCPDMAPSCLNNPLPAGDAVVTPDSQQQIISNIQVFGKTLGGESVQSNVFEFPINLATGLALVGNVINGTCASINSSATSSVTPPCSLGQDQVTDCSLCQYSPFCVCGLSSCDMVMQEPTPDAGGGG